LKFLFRDSLLVFFSVIAVNFITEQLSPVIQNGGEGGVTNPAVFTDNPAF